MGLPAFRSRLTEVKSMKGILKMIGVTIAGIAVYDMFVKKWLSGQTGG